MATVVGHEAKRRLHVVKGPTPETQLPCNPEAERNVLGSILIHPDAAAEVIELLQPSDFYRDANATIFASMAELYADGKPVDLVTVNEHLRAGGKLAEIGGQSYVSSLPNNVVTHLNARHYAEILLHVAAQREAMAIGSRLTADSFQPGEKSIVGVVAEFTQKLNGVLDRLASASVGNDDVFTADELMAMDLPELEYVVENLIPIGLSILASKQKVGKSWLMLALALAVAQGGVALGNVAVEQGDVLYLALEDTKKRLQNRTKILQQGAAVPKTLTLATKWPRLDQGGTRKIEQWLREHSQARLIIVDVLAKIRPPRQKHADIYAEDYALMTPLKDLADKYGVAIVVIHHTRKAAAEDVFDEIRDSSGLTGAADAVMVLQRPRGESRGTLHITGRDVDEDTYALKFERSTALWQLTGRAEDVGRTEARHEVLDLLARARRPMTPTNIADALDKNINTVKSLLSRMARDGEITNHYNGTYSCNPSNSCNPDNSCNPSNPVASAECNPEMQPYAIRMNSGAQDTWVAELHELQVRDAHSATQSPESQINSGLDDDICPASGASHVYARMRTPDGRLICVECQKPQHR